MLTSLSFATLELGFIYAIVTLGIYLSFRIIQFPDLTVEGSFALGAAMAALAMTQNVPPSLAITFAFGAGVLAGLLTSFLHVYAEIKDVLAGIITMCALYSINIRIMGKPNLALLDQSNIFEGERGLLLVVGIVVCLIVLLAYFLLTELGLRIRIAGKNPALCQYYGHAPKLAIVSVLGISNGLVAGAGGLFALSQGFADVSMGTGTIVIGLASLLLGELVLPSKKIIYQCLATLLGALIYRILLAVALQSQSLGLSASDLNLMTAVLVTCVLLLPRFKTMIAKKWEIKQL